MHFDWVKKYGPIYRAWGGFRPVAILSSPELMEVRQWANLFMHWCKLFSTWCYVFLMIADLSQPETHHQGDRVQLPESLAGQLHVPDDGRPLEEPPSSAHSRLPLSNPQQFRRRFQREECRLRPAIKSSHRHPRRRRIRRLPNHDAMRIGHHLR